MRRREFIWLLGGAAFAWPLTSRTQSSKRIRVVGGLFGLAETDLEAQARVAAFRDQLAELGWGDNNKIRFEFRFFGSNPNAGKAFATELINLAPDAIWTVPVVFVNVADPVGGGYVASLSRPGGNITGFTNFEFTVEGKWLQTLKDIAPSVTRVAIVHSPETRAYAAFLPEIERVGSSLGVSVSAAGAHDDAAEIERTITAHVQESGVA